MVCSRLRQPKVRGEHGRARALAGADFGGLARVPASLMTAKPRAGAPASGRLRRALQSPTHAQRDRVHHAARYARRASPGDLDGAGSDARGGFARTVQVVPIASEAALRNRAWVEGNLKKVDSLSGGSIAYVYVPDTGNQGHDYFKRYFYPQAQKDAVIVDERFNGGGQFADYYIDILRRPAISYWAMRYGDDMKTPTASIQGPKAMLIDETAGSGGDMLPWMFHNLKMGPLIGKRTWGGLVGILGLPVLMDGGTITAPNFAIWTPQEGWVVENVGVPPDIEVEMSPAEVIAGHDPQLEKAVEVLMAELKKNPPARPKRPAYPNKVMP